MLNNQYYRAAYEFHQKWSPYPVTLDDWSKAAGDMCKISNEGDNDMLLMDLLVSVYSDLGAIEYEPEINGVPQSVFFASQKAQKEADAKRYAEERRKAAERAAQRRNCPFRDSNSMNTDCEREKCALFVDGCTLARLTPAKDTEGLQCPFDSYRRKCRKDCALYKNGCTLTGLKESEDK